MENDEWQMSRAKPTRFYLSFIIFHLPFFIFEMADFAESLPHRTTSLEVVI